MYRYERTRFCVCSIFVSQGQFMKRYTLLLLLTLSFGTLYSQSNVWKGYFSFSEIRDMAQGPTKMTAASENALFSQNLSSGEIKTTTTVDGLSGQSISAVFYSQTHNKTLIGYENGLLTIVNEADNRITKLVDIINKQLPPNIKKINHFNQVDDMVYIATDFGICQFNLTNNQFGDTYFIGQPNSEIVVRQTAYLNGHIYAATLEQGILKADISNPNLIDAQNWTSAANGAFEGIQTLGTQLVAITPTGQMYRSSGGAFLAFSSVGAPVDFRVANEKLVVSAFNKVTVYNENLSVASSVNSWNLPESTARISCATWVGNNLYIGTTAFGVFVSDGMNPGQFLDITPAGPKSNNIFSINTQTPNLWLTYGGYPVDFDPFLRKMGLSKYGAEGWSHIPYSEVHAPGKEATDLVRITFNPSNTSQFYVSSYHSGLLKFENDALVQQFDHTNSNNGLESVFVSSAPAYKSVRIEQSAFDPQGNLWMTNGLVESGLKVLRSNGSWQSYNLGLADYFIDRYSRMLISSNGVKWFATLENGVVGFNENGNIVKKIKEGSEAGNLPSNTVRALALDKREQIWIGTDKGIRVLHSAGSFNNDNQMMSYPVIIQDTDGVAQELLYEQWITDIAVDGSNNKWIGTMDSGVFVVSPNGQETKYHFTISNSPLPTNAIQDIEINGTTGEVFIATEKGMISFGGIATDASDNLENVYVYPNPVRPEFTGTVKIANLTDKANVKITDISGNLVYEAISEGGTIEWDTTAFGKYRVSSGVYMIFVASKDGTLTKVKKVMVIR